MRTLISIILILFASQLNAERIEGNEAFQVVKEGSIIAGKGSTEATVVWDLLIEYKKRLHNCRVFLGTDGLTVHFCFKE